jgi:hypothetical protein
MPYQEENLQHFILKHKGNPNLQVASLGKTRKGRNMECLYLGKPDTEPMMRVLLTCRHHCCEMMASYVLEGMIDALLCAEIDDFSRIRESTEFMIIPFVDKDGVEDGDQGKNRRPHDHNRDYGDDSIYESIRALKQVVPAWSGKKLKVALDLHCPYISGGLNESAYIVGSSSQLVVREQRKLLQHLAECSMMLPVATKNIFPFGEGWNTKSNYATGKSFTGWAGELPEMQLATTLEIPYANADGVEVNQNTAYAFGGDIALALARYL